MGPAGKSFTLLVVLPVAVFVGVALLAFREVEGTGTTAQPSAERYALIAWPVLAGVILWVILGAGRLGRTRQWFGSFIDARNRYSLSRVQIAAWTVLVISAWLAIVVVRFASGLEATKALDVDIPDPVLATLGISTASWLGATAIKDKKRQRRTTVNWQAEQQLQRTRLLDQIESLETRMARLMNAKVDSATGTKERAAADKALQKTKAELTLTLDEKDRVDKILAADAQAAGVLASNSSPLGAEPADLFLGEEVGDYQTTDFGKVQMFFVTMSLVLAYALSLSAMIRSTGLLANPGTLPTVGDSFNVLLGISHAGYLGTKVSDSQPSEASTR